MHSPIQQISLPVLKEKKVTLHLKREDLIHPLLSGNKFRKLKYNLLQAKKEGHQQLLTFGGAFSNHIVATAYAAKENGLGSIGIIRGQELEKTAKSNPTLALAKGLGMKIVFIDRTAYRKKEAPDFLERLEREFGRSYILPEGGTNTLALKGCREILGPEEAKFDLICCAVGTGATLGGLIQASTEKQRLLGFPVLKGDFLKEDIRSFVRKENWNLREEYHFGGYAKVNKDLIIFINTFKQKTGIPLDPVYTGKMMYGLLHMIEHGHFQAKTRLLAIHTGGLQGIAGMNQYLKKKNLPLIEL